MAGSAFSPSVLRIMRDRADGRCEGCGKISAHLEAHHRVFRSRGGQGTVENGLYLCGWGNHTGCHGAAHGQGDYDKAWGWSLQSWQDPAAEPFTDLAGRTWMLRPDGTRELVSEEPAGDVDPWEPVTVDADPWSAA